MAELGGADGLDGEHVGGHVADGGFGLGLGPGPAGAAEGVEGGRALLAPTYLLTKWASLMGT